MMEQVICRVVPRRVLFLESNKNALMPKGITVVHIICIYQQRRSSQRIQSWGMFWVLPKLYWSYLNSPPSLLNQVKKELEDADGDLEPVKGLITLCMLHHWTVKAYTLQRILSNCVQIMSTLVCCLDDREFLRSLDASHSAEISGMLQQFQSFSFFFSLKTSICTFQVSD